MSCRVAVCLLYNYDYYYFFFHFIVYLVYEFMLNK